MVFRKLGNKLKIIKIQIKAVNKKIIKKCEHSHTWHFNGFTKRKKKISVLIIICLRIKYIISVTLIKK